jgi:glycosyltransferase involved in cell wall biosynthesis
MKVSVIIPAHNEEKLLSRCLESLRVAGSSYEGNVEVIVVCNRCSDRTEFIAKDFGSATLFDDSRRLARIRNLGVAKATGDIIITIDADSWMTPGVIKACPTRLRSGRYVGGGAWIRPERMSLGIICSLLMVVPFVIVRGVSGGLFWCYKRDFEAIGGFDESLVSVEDLDFAVRLKRSYGYARVGGSYRYREKCTGWFFGSCICPPSASN